MTPPLVIGLDNTWDKKVVMDLCVFSQTGASSRKSFCSIKLCFFQRGIQPTITVVFWGKERGIADFDKEAYDNDILLL